MSEILEMTRLAQMPIQQLPQGPSVPDSVDRLDFSAVFHNEVELPDA